MGKSLIPPGGGHSLIEPLSYGLPVLHGPYVENIGHVSEIASKQGLVFQVANAEELEQQAQTFLGNTSLRFDIAEKAKTFIAQQQGTSKKMAQVISQYLDIPEQN